VITCDPIAGRKALETLVLFLDPPALWAVPFYRCAGHISVCL
jgi:hypothetical protein